MAMARNPVQFQKGLSLAELNAWYGGEKQCHAALIAMRWPQGFMCPKCGGRKYSYAKARQIFQCSACRTQTSARAGTIFHKSTTPLVKWFLAIYLLTQSKNDIAALELARQLGVKWDTAWLINRSSWRPCVSGTNAISSKAMYSSTTPIWTAKSQASAGGERRTTPFVIAVETREDKPVYTQLRRVAGFTSQAVKTYAAANIEAGARVTTDGLACFAAVTAAGMKHQPIITGGGRPDEPEFKWVNTTLGNIKRAITGTCRAVRPRHSARYLAAYEYRFNRRFELDRMVQRLAAVAADTAPHPRSVIATAEMPG